MTTSDALAGFTLFESLDENERTSILELSREEAYPRNAMIIRGVVDPI